MFFGRFFDYFELRADFHQPSESAVALFIAVFGSVFLLVHTDARATRYGRRSGDIRKDLTDAQLSRHRRRRCRQKG
jgi:hypothetical protein